jgi:DNA polymerase III epsilon subunit-like protein
VIEWPDFILKEAFQSSVKKPCYICVDVEAAGPNPGSYSLLSIGAATVELPRRSFYAELKPLNKAQTEEAAEVHGLSLERLAVGGESPKKALARFEGWLGEVCPEGRELVFVAFNAPFDWMFVQDYFQRYLGHNPFGHRALDIKALFMGMQGVDWAETSHQTVSRYYGLEEHLPHHAEKDALQEAEIFAAMLAELAERNAQFEESAG